MRIITVSVSVNQFTLLTNKFNQREWGACDSMNWQTRACDNSWNDCCIKNKIYRQFFRGY